MIDTEKDLDRALAGLFAERHGATRARDPDEHLDPDTLFAYLAGELAEDAVERVQAHLEECRQCSALLFELEPFATADAPPAEDVADFEREAAWRTFREGCDGSAQERVARSSWGGHRLLRIAAVVLLLSTAALSTWVVRLQRSTGELRSTLAELSAPRLNVPVLYLDATRAEEPDRIELGPADNSFLLMMTPTDPREFPSYEVEILAAGDTDPLWNGEGLRMSEYGSVRLGLSRRFLPAGKYRVLLFGRDGETRELLEEYLVEIR